MKPKSNYTNKPMHSKYQIPSIKHHNTHGEANNQKIAQTNPTQAAHPKSKQKANIPNTQRKIIANRKTTTISQNYNPQASSKQITQYKPK